MCTNENGDQKGKARRGRRRVHKEYSLGVIKGLTRGDKDGLLSMDEDDAYVLRVMLRDSQGAMTLEDMVGMMPEKTLVWIKETVERLLLGARIVRADGLLGGGDVYFARHLDDQQAGPLRVEKRGRGGRSRGKGWRRV